MDLEAITAALAARLREIEGLYVYDRWPGTPSQVPCCVIMPPDTIRYTETSRRGLDIATFYLLVIVGRMSPTSHATLLGYLSGTGAASFITKIGEDRTLGGAVAAIKVTEVTTGLYVVARNSSDETLGCEIAVEIAA
jgi:hypothetical protein